MSRARLNGPGPSVPRTRGVIAPLVGRLLLRLTGWRITGEFPDTPKAVIIVAPHTSNWDFPVGLAAKWKLRLRASFLGKDTLFRFPLGVLMRAWGGIPVDRSQPHAVVSTTVEEFGRRDQLWLAIAPEGTRSRVERWRTGFYHIAHGAGVPVVPVGFDWSTRTIRIHPAFTTTGNAELDVLTLQRMLADAVGRNAP